MHICKNTIKTALVLYFVLFVFVYAYSFVQAQEIAEPLSVQEVDVQPVRTTAATVEPYSIEKLDDDGRVVGDFVVGPGKIELSLEPGESETIELLVTNRMGETKDFLFEIEDITGSQDPNKAVVLLGSDRGPYTLRDYLSVEATSFTLGHMERARVPVTISIPADAESGGRYGSVLVSTVSRDAETDVSGGATPQSAIVSRIGTLFFITIPGDTSTEGSLVDFSTLGDTRFFAKGPINFNILFENTGAIHLNPYGEISIINTFGEEVGFVELDPWFALPQSLRTREVTWNRDFMVGRYTAEIALSRGYDDLIDTQVMTFWVLPWKLFVGAFGGLFIFFLLLRLIFSKFEFKRK